MIQLMKKTSLIDPIELDKNQNHVMVFDDVMLEDQTMMKKYFCSGRHNNVNVFYLVQSLHKIAKHCIRENANMFILFKQDDRALKYFYETHLSGDMDFKEFKQFCDDAWTKKHGFVVINCGITHILDDFGIIIITFIFHQNINKYKINLIIYKMTLQPIKDVSEYRRLKQTLRDRFDNERTGDQNLFEGTI